MAYDIGYVDNTGSEGLAHWQMLAKIKELAEANGWTTLRYLTPSDGSNRELILKGVGLSGDQEIFIGFRSYHSVSADYYNLSAAGFTGYVAGNTFDTQPGYTESGVPGHNQRIDYWIALDAAGIHFGLKVGTPVYEHGGAGYFSPYATPGQYPYPLYVAGMLTGIPATRYSDTAHSMPWKGNRAGLKIRFVDGTWKQPSVWPWNNSKLTTLRDTGDDYPLMPLILNDASNIYGELPGLHYVSGFNNVTETIIQVGGTPVADDASWTSAERAAAIIAAGGQSHVVLQDVGRTGFSDYVALELR